MAVVEIRAGWWYQCGCGWVSRWMSGETTSIEFTSTEYPPVSIAREIGYHKRSCTAVGAIIGPASIVIIRPPVGLPDPRAGGPDIAMVPKWL